MRDVSPSRWSRRILIALLASVAAAVAIYLALVQSGRTQSVWDPLFGGGSVQVLNSRVSRAIRDVTGLPDSALGALAYGSEIVFALIGSVRRWREHPWLVLIFGANSAALAVAAIALVGMQAFVVHAWCLLCLVSAAISLTIAPLAVEEVRSAVQALRLNRQ